MITVMIGLLEDKIEVESISNRTKLIKMLLKEVGVGESEQTRGKAIQGKKRFIYIIYIYIIKYSAS